MTFRLLGLLGLLAAVGVAAQGGMSAADQKLLSDYKPTMQKLADYESAIAKLNAACREDPVLAEDAQEATAHPGESLREAIQRVKGDAFYARYLKPAGLEPADAVLLPLVLMGAGAVVEMNADRARLPGLTSQHVEFYRANQAQIGKMRLNADCPE